MSSLHCYYFFFTHVRLLRNRSYANDHGVTFTCPVACDLFFKWISSCDPKESLSCVKTMQSEFCKVQLKQNKQKYKKIHTNTSKTHLVSRNLLTSNRAMHFEQRTFRNLLISNKATNFEQRTFNNLLISNKAMYFEQRTFRNLLISNKAMLFEQRTYRNLLISKKAMKSEQRTFNP